MQRFCVAFHNKNVCANDDLMSRENSLACFLDTSTTNELAGGVFSLLHDYFKLAEGAQVNENTKLTKA